MNKFSKALTLAVLGCFLLVGSAFAMPLGNAYNPISNNGWGDDTLQTIVDNVFDTDKFDVGKISNQTGVAGWTSNESDISSYKLHVQGQTGGSGVTAKLGLYDLNSNNEYTFASGNESFSINKFGYLKVGVDNAGSGWSKNFGFYLDYNGSKYYSEDDKNDSDNSHMVSYKLKEGTTWDSYDYFGESDGQDGTLKGDDDWLLAFDINDPTYLAGRDFNELVVLLEDMSAVPEPATMVLFGIGLLGLAGVSRKKMN